MRPFLDFVRRLVHNAIAPPERIAIYIRLRGFSEEELRELIVSGLTERLAHKARGSGRGMDLSARVLSFSGFTVRPTLFKQLADEGFLESHGTSDHYDLECAKWPSLNERMLN